MIGFVLYETLEVLVYGTKAAVNTVKSAYSWIFSKEDESNSNDYIKLKRELREELKKDIITMMEEGKIKEISEIENNNDEDEDNRNLIEIKLSSLS